MIEKATTSFLKTVLSKVTFYLIRNDEISVIEPPVIETTGTNEFNFMISGFDTGNSFSKKGF